MKYLIAILLSCLSVNAQSLTNAAIYGGLSFNMATYSELAMHNATDGYNIMWLRNDETAGKVIYMGDTSEGIGLDAFSVQISDTLTNNPRFTIVFGEGDFENTWRFKPRHVEDKDGRPLLTHFGEGTVHIGNETGLRVASNGVATVFGTLEFATDSSPPINTNTPDKWVQVQLLGDTNQYRIPLYK